MWTIKYCKKKKEIFISNSYSLIYSIFNYVYNISYIEHIYKDYKQRLTNSCHRKINASLALRMGLELIYANI